jgi:hypothetical protein
MKYGAVKVASQAPCRTVSDTFCIKAGVVDTYQKTC